MNPKSVSLVVGAVLIFSGCARQNPVEPAPFNVGVFILDISKEDGKTLAVAVWYPTTEEPEAYQYMNPHKTTGEIAYEGEPDREHGPYPLLVYSHGYGGGAYAGIYVAEHFASHGFVVAAPDHDDTFAVMRIDGGGNKDMQEYFRSAVDLGRSGTDFDRKAHAYRPEDVSLVIDEMLRLNRTESLLHGIVNEHAIGGIGHSLGGYTMLMVGGIDEAHYDSRITALLLYSAGVFMFEDEEYHSITVPVMFMYGEREGSEVRATFVNEKAADTERAYENCQPPKFLLAIKGANHFSFGQSVFQDQWPGMGAEEGQKQADVICAYSLAFFEYYLKGDLEAENMLKSEDEMVALYRKEMNPAF